MLPRAIAVSEFIAGHLRNLGYRGNIDVIPAGVRLEMFTYRAPRTNVDRVRVAFVGRLVRRKGLDVLLDAIARLPESQRSSLTVSVIGDGPERGALEAQAVELGVTGSVDFLGAVPRPQVIETLEQSDVFVMSSRTMPNGEAEGSPVVTKEAQAIGLPMVVTDSGGTRETVPEELQHEVVPEDDPAALAERLEHVLGNPADWQRRSALGRRYVEEAFSWRRLAERSAEVYRELVNGR
jgi:glycosyltransferase involved in cell wall biosynthesis